jgi:hypothetical protein
MDDPVQLCADLIRVYSPTLNSAGMAGFIRVFEGRLSLDEPCLAMTQMKADSSRFVHSLD